MRRMRRKISCRIAAASDGCRGLQLLHLHCSDTIHDQGETSACSRAPFDKNEGLVCGWIDEKQFLTFVFNSGFDPGV
jgi:hypothetical protein